MDSFHLDSSSFHVHGDYGTATDDEPSAQSGLITITYGYSRDHQPDLKQFILDLMWSADGDIPLLFKPTSRTSKCNKKKYMIFFE